jgi:hypothetical protein
MRGQKMRFQLTAVSLACAALLSACGGGGGGGGGEGGATGNKSQSVDFAFPGARYMLTPTKPLVATASSGLPVTFKSNTPSTCSIDGVNLVVLKGGECSVEATQAGDSTYMPASARQLFNVLKHTQFVNFASPGFQSITGTPPALVATAESGAPVTFSSDTPVVCTVSGAKLTLVSKGTCSITATQAGNDSYDVGTAKAVFVVGDDKPPVLTVMSGFKSASQTIEGGNIFPWAGSNKDGWWCADSNWCSAKLNADGSFSWRYSIQPKDPKHPNTEDYIGAYYGMDIDIGGVSISNSGNTTAGLMVGNQSSLKLKFGQNAEWFGTPTNDVKVILVLGHYVKKANGDSCNIALTASVKAVAAAPTAYEMQLSNFTGFDNSCDLSGLKAATELTSFPIVRVKLAASSPNVSVLGTPEPNPSYPTVLTLVGGITIE